MKNDFMTKLDILGTKRLIKEALDYRLKQTQLLQKPTAFLESFEDLMSRDKQREKDGFQKKIKIKNILAGPDKVIMVPYAEEEKLIHGEFEPTDEQNEGIPGHGEGEIGDVILETPIGEDGEGQGEDDEPQAGQGEDEHGIEAEAYEMGKMLLEKFQLPNMKDKGKKIATNEYVYDLTDRHKGSGQFLDKKATLKSIIKTNAALGRFDKNTVDMTKLAIGPQDKIYRVLSREKVWKSQAVVFFLRDYSGSMSGEPTKIILAQHLMIYAWLLVQYEKLVIPRFIVHDGKAREVSVDDYFRKAANGGTFIASGYREINKIVENDGLARNYNIYVFQGTDGEDFDKEGEDAIPEIEKIISYVNRMGVCVLKSYFNDRESEFEQYVKKGGFTDRTDLFRMHVMPSRNITEEVNIDTVKKLIAQELTKNEFSWR